MSIEILPAAPAENTLLYRWRDPSGIVRLLSGNTPVAVAVGEGGLGIPALEMVADKLPSSPGDVVRWANTQSRTVRLPLLIGPVANGAALDSLMDSVYDWFDTASEDHLTPGYLQCLRRNGTWREMALYYLSGLEGDDSLEASGDNWCERILTLRAATTWTQGIADTVKTYTQADLATSLPVLNGGRLAAYPVWTITGPASAIVISNLTSGEAFSLTADGGLTLTAGQTLVIDTREPNERATLQVIGPDGLTRFSKLTATSTLWTLRRGSNSVQIDLTGATSDTEIELRFRERFRGMR